MRDSAHLRRTLVLTTGIAALIGAAALAQREGRANREEWQRPEQVVREMHLRPGDVVADIGSGRGYFLFRFAEAVGDTGKALGVDIDEGALETARKRAEEEGVTNVEMIHSEATDTKLKPASVDTAFICMVLHHVPVDQQQPLLQSIAKALKPGGYLYVIDVKKGVETPFRWHGEQLPREDLIERAKGAGLALDADFYCLEYQYLIRFVAPKP